MSEVQNVQSADERMQALLDKPAPEAWIPKGEGDTITGAFISLESGATAYGPAPFVVLGTAAGEIAVWLFYESMKTGFLRAKPQPGEIVAIRYEGEKPVKNATKGRKATYHDYRVAVDRPEAGPVSWDALAVAAGSEPVEDPAPDEAAA